MACKGRVRLNKYHLCAPEGKWRFTCTPSVHTGSPLKWHVVKRLRKYNTNTKTFTKKAIFWQLVWLVSVEKAGHKGIWALQLRSLSSEFGFLVFFVLCCFVLFFKRPTLKNHVTCQLDYAPCKINISACCVSSCLLLVCELAAMSWILRRREPLIHRWLFAPIYCLKRGSTAIKRNWEWQRVRVLCKILIHCYC